MRQTELHLADEDRLVIEVIRGNGLHQSRDSTLHARVARRGTTPMPRHASPRWPARRRPRVGSAGHWSNSSALRARSRAWTTCSRFTPSRCGATSRSSASTRRACNCLPTAASRCPWWRVHGPSRTTSTCAKAPPICSWPSSPKRDSARLGYRPPWKGRFRWLRPSTSDRQVRGRAQGAPRAGQLNIHFKTCFEDVLGKRAAGALLRRVRFHYTPKHASWLNMAEI